MMAERVEDADAGRWFSPAILSEPDQLGCGSYRDPPMVRGAVRSDQRALSALMLRLLDLIKLPYHIFTYRYQMR
jgi:hypothetical protein